LALIDIAADKLQGEMLDLQHGSSFVKNAKVIASTGMSIGFRLNMAEKKLNEIIIFLMFYQIFLSLPDQVCVL
jgi:malate/lactate dehydrogenase